mgnify:CR=1 FL=1
MTNQPQFGLALAYVTDIEAAKRFYVDVLGLEVQRDNPVHPGARLIADSRQRRANAHRDERAHLACEQQSTQRV